MVLASIFQKFLYSFSLQNTPFGTLRYSIVPQDGVSGFVIDPVTGVISVSSSLPATSDSNMIRVSCSIFVMPLSDNPVV